MAKFKVKKRDCHLYVKAKLSFKEKINERQLEIFSGQYIRGLLKVAGSGKHTIDYSGPVGISLCERLKRPLSKSDFFFIMEQIVDLVQKLNQNSLIISNTVFDLNNVFINEKTRELQFIYLPLEQKQQNADVLGLIESIVYSAHPMEEQDSEYVSRFIYFVKNFDRFDADKLEQYIYKEDRSVVNIIKRHNVGQSGYMTDKPGNFYEHYNAQSNGRAQRTRDTEATGILEEATGMLEEEMEATGMLEESEATGILDENFRQVYSATLYRFMTNETISINKPVFRIGTEKNCCDYFVTNNDKVSRNHADIITKGRRYYIRDLHSKNRTFVNGHVTPIQQDVEIYNGDHITLANEEFEFRF